MSSISLALLRKKLKKHSLWMLLGLVFCLILVAWTADGYQSVHFDTDMGRDLKEISNIQAGKLVWLGPRLEPGLHASSIYYYLFAPAILISNGQVSSMITLNLLIGFSAITFLGILMTKKFNYTGVLATAIIGLMPILTDNALHPGNGYTHVFFALISLTSLVFDKPILVTSFFAGLASALHPTSGFLLLLIFLKTLDSQNKIKNTLIGLISFLIPFIPLIAFEIITKGYVARKFIENYSNSGLRLRFNLVNFGNVARLFEMPKLVLVAMLVVTWRIIVKKDLLQIKKYFLATITILLLLLFLPRVNARYLWGLILSIGVFSIFVLIRKKAYTYLMGVWLLVLFVGSPIFHRKPKAKRTINEIEYVAEYIKRNNLLDTNKKIAIVSALKETMKVPQADDYRFLLRNKGYEVVEVDNNNQADQLLYVIERNDFDWKDWSNWEIEKFGKKKIKYKEKFDDKIIVVFDKVN